MLEQKLRKLAINIIDVAIKAKRKIVVNIENFSLSDDSSGQREYYLDFFSYGKVDHKCYGTGLYKIKRRLTFVNQGDEGKQDAVLGVLIIPDIKDIKDISVVYLNRQIEIKVNSITITIINRIEEEN